MTETHEKIETSGWDLSQGPIQVMSIQADYSTMQGVWEFNLKDGRQLVRITADYVTLAKGYEPDPTTRELWESIRVSLAAERDARRGWTLETAVAVLNDRGHRGCKKWRIQEYAGGVQEVLGQTMYDRLERFEAIAIADRYQRDRAKAINQKNQGTEPWDKSWDGVDPRMRP
jgi:hypothetical protein